jgi:hypothetical protein
MLAFLHNMIQSGIQDEPYAWPLHAFVTSLQKACLQIRSEKTRAQRMLRQAHDNDNNGRRRAHMCYISYYKSVTE